MPGPRKGVRGRRLARAAALGLAGGLASAGAQADNAASDGSPSAVATIDIAPSESGIEIVGGALAIAPARLTGEIVINRSGKSGTVSTRQSSELDLDAGETGDIARNGISFDEGDRLEVTVTLSVDGEVVSTSRLETGGN